MALRKDAATKVVPKLQNGLGCVGSIGLEGRNVVTKDVTTIKKGGVC